MPPSRSPARRSSAWHASAVSGVRGDGFQITESPHTSASAVFQLHTATGKLNAVITATGPSGCHVSSIRCPGRSDAIVRPNSWRDRPDAEVADVDHLLHLAEALGHDLAGLERDQRAEVVLRRAQLLAQQAHQLAAARCGHVAPHLERGLRAADRGVGVGGRRRRRCGRSPRR